MITLYIKTHNTTGLRYFGKTAKEGKAFDRYRGSGTYWKSHIKLHGYDVTTKIVAHFLSEEECTVFALKFSFDNNIVNDDSWANLMEENGIDGWVPGQTHSAEARAKIGAAMTGKKFGPRSAEIKAKLAAAITGRKLGPRSAETKAKIAAAMTGKKFGPLSAETKAKMSASAKNRKLSAEFKYTSLD